MTPTLHGLHILVVEDEQLIAMDMSDVIERHGGMVIGPAVNVEQARDLIRKEPVDGVILDVSLNSDIAFPLAEDLLDRGTPIIFATGYASPLMPEKYAGVPCLTKPVAEATLIQLIDVTFRR